jgi:hypothetical protein
MPAVQQIISFPDCSTRDHHSSLPRRTTPQSTLFLTYLEPFKMAYARFLRCHFLSFIAHLTLNNGLTRETSVDGKAA